MENIAVSKNWAQSITKGEKDEFEILNASDSNVPSFNDSSNLMVLLEISWERPIP